MNRKAIGILLMVFLSTGLFLIPVKNARTQSTVELHEKKLIFSGPVNDSLQRTFNITVKGKPIKKLLVICQDLVDSNTQAVLLSKNIEVIPANRDEVHGSEKFTVTVKGGKKAGHFTGSLKILYADQPEDESLSIDLDVTLEAFPSVEVGESSGNPTLVVKPSWYRFSFGRPIASNKPVLGEVTVSLIQKGDGEAVIENAEVLTLRGSKGQTLPQNAARVETNKDTKFPLTLSNIDATSINVVAGGKNLKADEYNGTLHIKVSNQNSIQIPIKVQVKDGPLLPLILLVIASIVGILLSWWNNEGRTRNELRKRIRLLEAGLGYKKMLQVDIQQKVGTLLDELKSAMVVGEKVAAIEKQLKAITKTINAAQEEAKTFLEEELEPFRKTLDDKAKALPTGKAYHNKLSEKVQEIEAWVNDGKFQRLADARSALDATRENMNLFAEIIEEFEKLPDNAKNQVKPSLDIATSIEAMEEEIKKAKETLTTDPNQVREGALDVERLPGEHSLTFTAADRVTWDSYKLKLKVQSFLVAGIVWLFTIVIGFITLYAPSTTFGTSPKDYITLLLWGITSNVVGGQTINLKAIYDKTKRTDMTI